MIGITTSGLSTNIMLAMKQAKKVNVLTILMTGEIPIDVEILSYTDCILKVPSNNTPRIQEIHILCALVEQLL